MSFSDAEPLAGGGEIDVDEGRQTCVLVDDDPLMASLMAQSFGLRGYTSHVARTGQAAISLARRHRPTFVLLDIGLPDVDGFKVLRDLRGDPATADIPVFMLTARSLPADQLRALQLGVAGYFTKPVVPRQLIQQIQDVLWARG